MATRVEVERLQTAESQTARQFHIASWLFVIGVTASTTLTMFAVATVVQIFAWVIGCVGLVLFVVRSIRLHRAWSARARAQSAVEEAEALERIGRREP